MIDLKLIGAAAFLLRRRERGEFAYADLNDACVRLTGWDRDLHLGRSSVELLGPETGAKVAAFQQQCADTKGQVTYETSADVPRGRILYQSTLTPLTDESGVVTTIFGVTSDITERKRLEDDLRISNLRLNLALEALGGAHWFYDARTRRFELSPAFDTLLGAPVPRIMSVEEWQEHVHEDDRHDTCFADLMAGRIVQGSAEFRIKSEGSTRWLRCRRRSMLDDMGVAGIAGIVVDITSEKRQEADLSRLATTDALTGLANRRRLDEWLASDEAEAPLSLLMIDVDHFKAYNDRYGHVAGDAALKKVAGVLQRTAALYGGFSARYGGEEFVVALPSQERDAAGRIAKSVIEDITSLLLVHEGSSWGRLSVSIGSVTSAEVPSVRPSGLVALADQALYRAKAAGRACYRVYTSAAPTRTAA